MTNALKLQPLENYSINIWNIEVADEEDVIAHYFNLLSRREKERARNYRFNKDKKVFITARAVLRKLSAKYLNENLARIQFKYNSYGKPTYLNGSNINFNVSHSGNRIIIGFAKNLEIGVDIENIKQGFDTLDLAKNFFSKEEINALSKISEEEKYRAFYRCWTRKESFIKAVGQGLSYPLDSFAVTLNDDYQAKFLKIDNIGDNENNWKLHSFIPAEDYIAALAVNGNPDTLQFFDWEYNGL